MEEYSKSGRKLRPRKNAGAPAQGEKLHFSKPFRSEEGKSGEHRNFGKARSSSSDRKPYSSDRKPYSSDRKPYSSDRKPYSAGSKPGFRKNFEQKPFNRDKRAEEGVNKMIFRRSTLDGNQARRANPKIPEFQEEIRLNKFIANSGVCSRREADTYIQAGVVTVNGEVVTELGTKVNVLKDEIRFNGERLKGESKVYIVMNKPRGFVTTASDPHADKTVMDLMKNCEYRVFPVGRLDKNTTGVLMLTNDGEISERLTHPSYDKKKIYQVTLDRPLSEEDRQAILDGVTLSDGPVSADELEFIDEKDHRKVGIELHSGKNRVVRRIFESTGYDVKALDRVYFAGLTKRGLKRGEWRYLTEGEINILKMGAYV